MAPPDGTSGQLVLTLLPRLVGVPSVRFFCPLPLFPSLHQSVEIDGDCERGFLSGIDRGEADASIPFNVNGPLPVDRPEDVDVQTERFGDDLARQVFWCDSRLEAWGEVGLHVVGGADGICDLLRDSDGMSGLMLDGRADGDDLILGELRRNRERGGCRGHRGSGPSEFDNASPVGRPAVGAGTEVVDGPTFG